VLYVAKDDLGAFIETAGSRTGRNEVTWTWLRNRAFTEFAVHRPLRLVDLGGSGLARLGADARITTGSYGVSQEWSRGFWSHPEKPDGIWYRARHDPDRISIALYDRAKKVVAIRSTTILAESRFERPLARILDHYRFGLILDE
jgi:hypothetical protein